MNITNITITKSAEEKTSNAEYTLEYQAVDGELTRVMASVRIPAKGRSAEAATELGTILLEQGSIVCSLAEGRDMAPYFSDFDTMLASIRQDIRKTGDQA